VQRRYEHVQNPERVLQEIIRCSKPNALVFLEFPSYYSLIIGHHLYDYGLFGAQFMPKRFVKWFVRRKGSTSRHSAEYMLHEFESLNKLTISQFKKWIKKYNIEVIKERHHFKHPDYFDFNISFIKHLPILREIIPTGHYTLARINKTISEQTQHYR